MAKRKRPAVKPTKEPDTYYAIEWHRYPTAIRTQKLLGKTIEYPGPLHPPNTKCPT
jgi:hypothetical protein